MSFPFRAVYRDFERIFLEPDSPEQRKLFDEERKEWAKYRDSLEPAREEQRKRQAIICCSRNCGCQFKKNSAPLCIYRSALKPKKRQENEASNPERTLEQIEAELCYLASQKRVKTGGHGEFHPSLYERMLLTEKKKVEDEIKLKLEKVREINKKVEQLNMEFEELDSDGMCSTGTIVSKTEKLSIEDMPISDDMLDSDVYVNYL